MLSASTQVYWYAGRSSGLVLWLLTAVAVAWGLAVSSRLVRRRGLPAWMLSLHRHLASLTVVFVAIHLLSLAADDEASFGVRELFVPMASRWRPGAVAWGVVAMYCLVVVQLTSWARRRLPRRVWHGVHLLSIPALVTGTAHGILAGTDWPNRAVEWGALLMAIVVVWLATFRVLTPGHDHARADALRRVRDVAPSPATMSPWGPPAAAARRALVPAGTPVDR